MKKLTVLLLVLLFTLTAAAPASADKPEYWYDQDFVWDFELVNCSDYGFDFAASVNAVGHESELLYFDKAGNVVRTLYQAKGTDYIYNSKHPSLGAFSPFNFSTHVTMTSESTWTRRFTGAMWNLQLPGYGVVIHLSGQIVEEVDDWVVTREIKRVGLDQFDYPALCAALAAH